MLTWYESEFHAGAIYKAKEAPYLIMRFDQEQWALSFGPPPNFQKLAICYDFDNAKLFANAHHNKHLKSGDQS